MLPSKLLGDPRKRARKNKTPTSQADEPAPFSFSSSPVFSPRPLRVFSVSSGGPGRADPVRGVLPLQLLRLRGVLRPRGPGGGAGGGREAGAKKRPQGRGKKDAGEGQSKRRKEGDKQKAKGRFTSEGPEAARRPIRSMEPSLPKRLGASMLVWGRVNRTAKV